MQPVTANLLKLLQHMNAHLRQEVNMFWRSFDCLYMQNPGKRLLHPAEWPDNPYLIKLMGWKKCIEHCSDIRNCKTYGFVILIVIRPSVLYICSGINCGYEVCSEILKIVQLRVRDFIGFKEEESQSKSPMLLFYYKP